MTAIRWALGALVSILALVTARRSTHLAAVIGSLLWAIE